MTLQINAHESTQSILGGGLARTYDAQDASGYGSMAMKTVQAIRVCRPIEVFICFLKRETTQAPAGSRYFCEKTSE